MVFRAPISFRITSIFRAFLCILVSLTTFLISSRAFAEIKQPKIVISEPVHDFGSVAEGVKVKHSFVVENQGTADLSIEQIVPGCGCTAALAAKNVLAPNEKTELIVELDTTGFSGQKSKGTRINTNDPLAPSSFVTLKGSVEPEIRFEPKKVSFGEVSRGSLASAVRVVVTSEKGAPLGKVTALSQAIEVLDEEGDELKRTFSVKIRAGAPLGELRERVGVEIGRAGQQRVVVLPVVGVVRGEIQVKPQQVAFGVISGVDKISRSVRIENTGSKAAEIRDIVSNHPAVELEKRVIEPGKVWVLKISVDPKKVKRLLNANVMIKTDHPVEREISVLLYGISQNQQ